MKVAIFNLKLLNVSANKNSNFIFVFLEKLSSNRIIVNNNTPLLLTGVNLRGFFYNNGYYIIITIISSDFGGAHGGRE